MARRPTTRYAVLGMLTHGPMSGYRLREEILASVGHFWHESFGQLYPTLTELEGEGLVRRADLEGGARSQPFELTEQGREALRTWLATEAESLSPERNELLLQVFFGRHAAPGVLLGHLRRHRERLAEARERYLDIERVLLAEESPDSPYWLLTVRHGLTMVEAGLRWNAEATASLQEGTP